jgi:hypothetical protein
MTQPIVLREPIPFLGTCSVTGFGRSLRWDALKQSKVF